MPAKRHLVNVMRPTKATGDYGETQGAPEELYHHCPCSIEQISGREGEIARQTVPTATHRVKLYADPRKPIDARCYLTGGSIGERVLQIGAPPNDKRQNGVELELLCGEEIHG